MPWGDILTTSSQCPLNTEEKTIRIKGQNVNGLLYYNDYIEWEMVLTYMDEFQADVICLVEPNLDMNKPKVKEEKFTCLKKMDKYAKLTKSASPLIYNKSEFKMGGTLMYSRGNWSGHVLEHGSEQLGQWSYQTFEGKSGKQVTIITTYRVGKAKNDSGTYTICNQQEKDLLVHKNRHLDP